MRIVRHAGYSPTNFNNDIGNEPQTNLLYNVLIMFCCFFDFSSIAIRSRGKIHKSPETRLFADAWKKFFSS